MNKVFLVIRIVNFLLFDNRWLNINYRFRWRQESLKKIQFITGVIVMIVGFFAYRFGVAMNIAKSSTVAEIVGKYVPGMFTLEQTGLILEFAGGIILLLGIILSVTSLIESKISYVPAPVQEEAEEEEIKEEEKRCKFCSAELGEDEIFCSACNKSQQ